ncbi:MULTISPECIES: glycosyltransferase [Bacillus]|uniref:glycosyltransferase n=1 Tax=Bacillus TaxID=1386 RepID=UPI00122F295C|nr:glycosyltransferase [Bacillus cereus]KAA2398112.1 glycosyltransferase [Bacillus cereus]MDH8002809.1 glycosyltransferase [Bacillus cereus]NKW86036.1 glycosyltransferase [Bacillus cereus]
MREIKFFIGTLSSGGAERVVSNLSLNMSADIEKEIILFGSNAKIEYPYKGNLIFLDKLSHKNIFYKLFSFMSRVRELKKIKKQNKDVPLISFLEYPNLINLLTYKQGKTIISVRNHMSSKHKKGLKSFFWNKTIKYFYVKADQIIAVSEEIKNDLVKNYSIPEKKVKVIYNSYSINEIEEMSKESIEEKYEHIFSKPVVITAGRLNRQKGQWHLIRAFREVKEKIPEANLVILGDGGLKEELINLSRELGILDDIYFLGFKNNPFKYIARSKVFILSSFHEGFPNALTEAMVCGIPIVSTDCLSGPREILAPKEFNKSNFSYELSLDRYGVLIPVCDGTIYGAGDSLTKEELIMANALIKLLQDQEVWDYYSQKSRERVNDFDIKNLIQEWENLI